MRRLLFGALLCLPITAQSATAQEMRAPLSGPKTMEFCANWPKQRKQIAASEFASEFDSYSRAMDKMLEMTNHLKEMEDRAFNLAAGQWADRTLSLARIVANSANFYRGRVGNPTTNNDAVMNTVISNVQTTTQFTIAGMMGENDSAAWTLGLWHAKQLTPWAGLIGIATDIRGTVNRDGDWTEGRDHMKDQISTAQSILEDANKALNASGLDVLNAGLQKIDGICNQVTGDAESCIQTDKGEGFDGRPIYRIKNTCKEEVFVARCVEANLPNGKGCGTNSSTWFSYGSRLRQDQIEDNTFNMHALGPLHVAACYGSRYKMKLDGEGGYYCIK